MLERPSAVACARSIVQVERWSLRAIMSTGPWAVGVACSGGGLPVSVVTRSACQEHVCVVADVWLDRQGGGWTCAGMPVASRPGALRAAMGCCPSLARGSALTGESGSQREAAWGRVNG